VQSAQVENIIEDGSREETLSIVFPPQTPDHVFKFFKFMQNNITLEGTGFGVKFRESSHGVAELMQLNGYDYDIYIGFIRDFEERLMIQYNNSSENKK